MTDYTFGSRFTVIRRRVPDVSQNIDGVEPDGLSQGQELDNVDAPFIALDVGNIGLRARKLLGDGRLRHASCLTRLDHQLAEAGIAGLAEVTRHNSIPLEAAGDQLIGFPDNRDFR